MLKAILLLKLNSFKAQLQYPASFLTQVLSVALIGFLSILSLLVLLAAFPSIGGWGFYPLGFMLALRQMAHGLHHGLFFSFFGHLWLVRRGEFDRMLVRPLHPILQIMASGLNLSSIGEFLPGAVLLAVTWPHVAVAWTPLNVAYLAVVLLSGAVIEWAVYLFFAGFDFWLGGRAGLLYIPSAFLHPSTLYPAHIYGRALAFTITFVLPYAFIAYYPTLYFFQMDAGPFPAYLAYLAPLVALVTAVVAIAFWSLGLRRYQSTGT